MPISLAWITFNYQVDSVLACICMFLCTYERGMLLAEGEVQRIQG